jgi:hypothetical protein
MKNISYLLLIICFVSCGKISPKGNIETKNIEISEFTNLDISGKFRVFFIGNTKNFIEVETYPNIADNLEISVKNNTLFIKEKRKTENVDFYNISIYSKFSPEKINISDSVEMNLSSEIKTDNFNLNLKNNAVFIGSINTKTAVLEMRDKSRSNFAGFTENAEIKISDTASLIAPYWKIENLNINSKNGSYAEINVKNSLKGNIRNTAKLIYYNHPNQSVKISETAKIENKNLE